jgi:hypothetical protein
MNHRLTNILIAEFRHGSAARGSCGSIGECWHTRDTLSWVPVHLCLVHSLKFDTIVWNFPFLCFVPPSPICSFYYVFDLDVSS